MSARQDTDMEVRAHADHHASLRLWLRLLSATTRIEDTIRQRLREQFDITLPRFDLMAQLERAPDGMKMKELSRRMMVTSGNITGITDQLVTEGLVERSTHPDDGRMVTVTVTPLGQQVVDFVQGLRVGYLGHAAGVFNDDELATLADLLGRLAESMLESFEPWLHAVMDAPRTPTAGPAQTTGISPGSEDTTSRTTALASPAS